MFWFTKPSPRPRWRLLELANGRYVLGELEYHFDPHGPGCHLYDDRGEYESRDEAIRAIREIEETRLGRRVVGETYIE